MSVTNRHGPGVSTNTGPERARCLGEKPPAGCTVARMEAFEQFCALDLEAEGLVVSEAVKFPVTRQTKKASVVEVQTHGYEVDLVGAREDRLVLATVKSYFGSKGVQAREVTGSGGKTSGYALLNDPVIRDGVLAAACLTYGYAPSQVRMRLYVGKFAGSVRAGQEKTIREWCGSQVVGGGAPIDVRSLSDIIDRVAKLATSTTYRDNPVLVTLKVLAHAGLLLEAKVTDQKSLVGSRVADELEFIGEDQIKEFDSLFERAMSFDGFGYAGGITEAELVAYRVRAEWVLDRCASVAVDDLLTALFTECRMLRFSGYPPTNRLFAYLRDLEARIDEARIDEAR